MPEDVAKKGLKLLKSLYRKRRAKANRSTDLKMKVTPLLVRQFNELYTLHLRSALMPLLQAS